VLYQKKKILNIDKYFVYESRDMSDESGAYIILLKFYQLFTGEERRIPFFFDDFLFCRSRVIGLDMTENIIFTLCRMIMDDSERDDSKRPHGLLHSWLKVRAMVFNATFNNISDISWQSIFLVEETEVP
jgi:hypothetical protein